MRPVNNWLQSQEDLQWGFAPTNLAWYWKEIGKQASNKTWRSRLHLLSLLWMAPRSQLCLLGSASEKILSCVSRLESTFPARQLIRNLLRYKLYNLLQCCFAPIFLFHGVMAVQMTVSFICYLSISSHSLTVFTAKTQSQSCLQAPPKCHYTVLFLSTPADLI